MNDIDKAVDEYLSAQDIIFEARYIGESSMPGSKHTSDEFRITFSMANNTDKRTIETPFWQGVGHRKFKRQGEVVARIRGDQYDDPCYVTAPTAASVLYCLFSDATMGEQTFEDFCGDLDLDTDSRKALDSYLECQKMIHRLRGVFTHAERAHLEALLEDY